LVTVCVLWNLEFVLVTDGFVIEGCSILDDSVVLIVHMCQFKYNDQIIHLLTNKLYYLFLKLFKTLGWSADHQKYEQIG